MPGYTNTNVMHHLDKPIRLLMWTIDEVVCVLIPVVFGFMIDAWFVGFFSGMLFCYLLRKFKAKVGSTGGLAQLAYWALPQHKLPKSNIKEFLS